MVWRGKELKGRPIPTPWHPPQRRAGDGSGILSLGMGKLRHGGNGRDWIFQHLRQCRGLNPRSGALPLWLVLLKPLLGFFFFALQTEPRSRFFPRDVPAGAPCLPVRSCASKSCLGFQRAELCHRPVPVTVPCPPVPAPLLGAQPSIPSLALSLVPSPPLPHARLCSPSISVPKDAVIGLFLEDSVTRGRAGTVGKGWVRVEVAGMEPGMSPSPPGSVSCRISHPNPRHGVTSASGEQLEQDPRLSRGSWWGGFQAGHSRWRHRERKSRDKNLNLLRGG